MLRILTTLLILPLILTISASDAQAKKKSKGNPKYASIVMDADTGMILSQSNPDKVLHPASLTKMMTMLLAFEAIDRGDIKKRDRMRISRHAASMQPSKLGLPAGQKIRVEDAIYALATKSANDIAVAMAEHLGGSESKFAAMMTARARTIGMHKTRFKNASGLHHKYQVSTARDMAKMARYILQRYPHYYRYFSTKSFTYRGKTYRNHNRLMDTYKGMDGFKTGYINASGFNLVASAYRDHRRLIGVVFGGRTTKSRNKHMASLLDKGFKKSGRVRIASLKQPPVPPSKPLLGVANNNAVAPTIKKKAGSSAGFTSLAALNTAPIQTQKQATASDEVTPNYTALTKALQEGMFGEMLGQGDFDPSVSKRLETGLIAISVHKGTYQPNPNPDTAVEKSLRNAGHAMISHMGTNKAKSASSTNNKQAYAPTNLAHPKDVIGKWAIQIGAYNSRVATDEALREATKKLPAALSQAKPVMIPLQTKKGLIFRARLGNLTQSEALQACKYFKNCMPIAPITTTISAR